jgi:hypothetical protein
MNSRKKRRRGGDLQNTFQHVLILTEIAVFGVLFRTFRADKRKAINYESASPAHVKEKPSASV